MLFEYNVMYNVPYDDRFILDKPLCATSERVNVASYGVQVSSRLCRFMPVSSHGLRSGKLEKTVTHELRGSRALNPPVATVTLETLVIVPHCANIR